MQSSLLPSYSWEKIDAGRFTNFWTALRTTYSGDKSQIYPSFIKLQQSMVWNSFGLEERGLSREYMIPRNALINNPTRNDRLLHVHISVEGMGVVHVSLRKEFFYGCIYA